MGKTKIDWCDKVWNPITGCTKVSAGCKNCYAERMAKRLAGRCGYPAENPFAVTLHPERLNEPLHWRKPQRIFVCSMGDLFHEAVDLKYIAAVFGVMAGTPRHTFIILTKRPARLLEFFSFLTVFGGKIQPHPVPELGACVDARHFYCRAIYNTEYFVDNETLWPPANVIFGTSVEDQDSADRRIDSLMRLKNAHPHIKIAVSYEPAIGVVDFSAYMGRAFDGERVYSYNAGLDQIIMGGESGPGARPMHPDWARSVRDQCKAAGVAFFLKQNGEWAPDGEVPFKEPKEAGRVIPMYIVWSSAGAHERGKLSSYHIYDENGQGTRFKKVGKKAAGCLLDGKEHKERP